MEGIDKKILNIIQEGLPIANKPFLILGKQLEIFEEDIISRIESLKNEGYIRRIGGIFNSKEMGYFSTLCAISVPEDMIDDVSKIINTYDEVTHNYIREHHYNMWFTIIAPSKERLDNIIDIIKKQTEVQDIINLPAVKLFKIKAAFNISEG